MSPSSEPLSDGPRKSPPRRKSRPKFEVPPEVVSAPPAAWVYRAEAVRQDPPRATPRSTPAQKGPADTMLDPTSLMLAAIETMAHTVAASTRIMLAAASLMGAPVEVTLKILGCNSPQDPVK